MPRLTVMQATWFHSWKLWDYKKIIKNKIYFKNSKIAETFADLLLDFVGRGYDMQNIELVGHSLGWVEWTSNIIYKILTLTEDKLPAKLDAQFPSWRSEKLWFQKSSLLIQRLRILSQTSTRVLKVCRELTQSTFKSSTPTLESLDCKTLWEQLTSSQTVESVNLDAKMIRSMKTSAVTIVLGRFSNLQSLTQLVFLGWNVHHTTILWPRAMVETAKLKTPLTWVTLVYPSKKIMKLDFEFDFIFSLCLNLARPESTSSRPTPTFILSLEEKKGSDLKKSWFQGKLYSATENSSRWKILKLLSSLHYFSNVLKKNKIWFDTKILFILFIFTFTFSFWTQIHESLWISRFMMMWKLIDLVFHLKLASMRRNKYGSNSRLITFKLQDGRISCNVCSKSNQAENFGWF